jgi:pimeloyl-ACP methyl ester carboxylesterase
MAGVGHCKGYFLDSKLMSLVQRLQIPDRPKQCGSYSGPRVAVIYGFMARRLMQRNLLHYLRSKGLSDVTLYGHLHSVDSISDDLQASRNEGQNLVILGYSQGGFQAVKVALELERRGVDVALLVSIAAGGLGRVFPGRWGFDPRTVPTNVDVCLNFFSKGDLLGCDRSHQMNEAVGSRASQRVENHMFHAHEGVSHIDLVRCYPEKEIKPAVRTHVIERIMTELSGLQGPDAQPGAQADSPAFGRPTA